MVSLLVGSEYILIEATCIGGATDAAAQTPGNTT
jgi:hypothetical protein